MDNGGHSVGFYPADFIKGTVYEISAWVYSAKPGMTVLFHALNSFKPLGKRYTTYWYRIYVHTRKVGNTNNYIHFILYAFCILQV